MVNGPSHRRLVGQPLLYAISIFASLGVFLVRSASLITEQPPNRVASLDMTKGNVAFASALVSQTWFSVMSGIITGQHFKNYFNDPSAGEIGMMVAVLEIGAFFTSIAAGRVGDMIGRRGTLFIGAVIFTIGGAVQTFTVGFWSMVVGRIVSGCGVGLLS
jgi:MFS family permease